MKKLLAVLMTVAMLMGLAVPAMAADPVVISVCSVSNVQPGDTVTIDVYIAGDYQAHTGNIRMFYDLEVLSTNNDALALGPVAAGSGARIEVNQEQGFVSLGIACIGDPISEEGVLFSVTFKVADDAEEGIIPLTLVIAENLGYMPIGEINATPIEATVVNGYISIGSEPVPTDPPVEPEKVVFKVESATVAPNGEVTVSLLITGDYAAHILTGSINYDAANLTLVKCDFGPVISAIDKDNILVELETETAGRIDFGFLLANEPMTGNGAILKLTFKAGDKEGTYPLDLAIKEFVCLNVGEVVGEPIEATAIDGSITVKAGAVDPNPPITGTLAVTAAGVMSILTGAGVVIFRKKQD